MTRSYIIIVYVGMRLQIKRIKHIVLKEGKHYVVQRPNVDASSFGQSIDEPTNLRTAHLHRRRAVRLHNGRAYPCRGAYHDGAGQTAPLTPTNE